MAEEGPLKQAEARLAAMEARIRTLEKRTTGTGTAGAVADENSALKQFQIQTLERLRGIAGAMEREKGQVVDLAVVEERDALKKENERLQKEMAKLQYRVSHLIKSLNEAEAVGNKQ